MYETAQQLGLNVRVIETTGNELIVIKRTDINAYTKKGLELALVDNLCQFKNLNWDVTTILDVMEEFLGFDPRVWGMDMSLEKELNIEDFFSEVENQKVKPKQEAVFTYDNQPSLFDEF